MGRRYFAVGLPDAAGDSHRRHDPDEEDLEAKRDRDHDVSVHRLAAG
jgi:hypothetical protein